MRYYKVENRILFQTKDEDDKVIGFGVKQPTYMKKYPYYKLALKADGTETILQSEDEIKEAEELTSEEAQKLIDTWTLEHSDIEEQVLGENGKFTGEITFKKPIPVNIMSFNVDKIKEKMTDLHKAVS